jgi:hypothetical protein
MTILPKLRAAAGFIRSEPLILVPNLMLFLFSYIIERLYLLPFLESQEITSDLIFGFCVIWFFHIIFTSLTLVLGKLLLSKTPFTWVTIFPLAKHCAILTFTLNLLIFLPLGAAYFVFKDGLSLLPILAIIVSLAYLSLSIILIDIVPTYFVLKPGRFVQTFKDSLKWIKKTPRVALLAVSFAYCAKILSTLIGGYFAVIPIVGPSVMSVLVRGYGSTIGTLVLLMLVSGWKAPDEVSLE